MRILLDLEASQRAGLSGGIGRYAFALARALASAREAHQVLLLLNGGLPERIDEIKAALDGLLPPGGVRVWLAPDWPRGSADETWRRAVEVRILTGFLASLEPDFLIVGLPGGELAAAAARELPHLRTVGVVAPERGADGKSTAEPLPDRLAALLLLPPLSPAALAARGWPAARPLIAASAAPDAPGLDAAVARDAAALLALAPTLPLAGAGPAPARSGARPRLAYLSPLPPERSGIAGYSADLLPALAEHYQIELVLADRRNGSGAELAHFPRRSTDWFRAHADRFDRVLYHMGNSLFHAHMFELLERAPGVVALHDVYLGHVQAARELEGKRETPWLAALHAEGGYPAAIERLRATDLESLAFRHACNLDVVRNALGLILHSEHALALIRERYGAVGAAKSAVVPMVRSPLAALGRAEARRRLGIAETDFLVCSFGGVGPTKQNARILGAWLASPLAGDRSCRLVFVGSCPTGPYGKALRATLAGAPEAGAAIADWVDPAGYRAWLAAADVAVQLRSASRGETSAAALDCLNAGLATVVNAHGSLAELPADAAVLLPEHFADLELAETLLALKREPDRRRALGERAADLIRTRHNPAVAARLYAERIEGFYAKPRADAAAILDSIGQLGRRPRIPECRAIAAAIADSIPRPFAERQLLLDVTETRRSDRHTGIERVARKLARAILEAPPAGYRVEPVFLSEYGGSWHYRYARPFALELLGCPSEKLRDEPVEVRNGDLLLGLDLSGATLVSASRAGLFSRYRRLGVGVQFLVYDLLPLQMPQFFAPEGPGLHEAWLNCVGRGDGAICISRSVATDLRRWLESQPQAKRTPFRLGWIHLGADFETDASPAVAVEAEVAAGKLAGRPTFLMVGTIEPRKGYLQAIAAFEELWRRGVDVNLAIVGNPGWRRLPDSERRTIPEILAKLEQHPERGRRLIWLRDAGDAALARLYRAASCLIAASEGEGFGLPVVEAAHHGLPAILRDIPVFREIGRDAVAYFAGNEPTALADAVAQWLDRRRAEGGRAPKLAPWRSWRESAAMLLDQLLGGPVATAGGGFPERLRPWPPIDGAPD